MRIILLLATLHRLEWPYFYGPIPICIFAFGLWAILDFCNLPAGKLPVATVLVIIIVLTLLKLALYYSWKTMKTDFEDEFGVEYKPPYYDYDELRRVHEYVHKHILVLAWKIHNFSGTVPREWKRQFRYALGLAHVMGFEAKFKTIRDCVKSNSLAIE